MRACLMVIAAASMLSGCGVSRGDLVVRTVQVAPELPAEARQPCRLSQPPDRALTAGETFRYWVADRLEVTACDRKRAAAIRAVDAATPPPAP